MRSNSLDIKNISIHDPFWSKHVDLVRNAIIPYQWEAMNDRIPDAESSHCLENFKIAAGRTEGEFYGAVFQDTDVEFLMCPAVTQGISRCSWMESQKGLDTVLGELRRCGEQFAWMCGHQDRNGVPEAQPLPDEHLR